MSFAFVSSHLFFRVGFLSVFAFPFFLSSFSFFPLGLKVAPAIFGPLFDGYQRLEWLLMAAKAIFGQWKTTRGGHTFG